MKAKGRTVVTHEDWQRAKDKRDRAALRAVRELLNGKTGEATQSALESDQADDEMLRISKILDGN